MSDSEDSVGIGSSRVRNLTEREKPIIYKYSRIKGRPASDHGENSSTE